MIQRDFENSNHMGDGRLMNVMSKNSLPSRELISAGVIEDYEMVHKFGRIAAATTSWQNVSDLGGMVPFTGVNLITPVLVGTNATDTQSIEVHGIKLFAGDWIPVKYTVVLNGITDVALPGDIMSVYRMKNVSDTTLTGDVNLIDRGDLDAVYAKIINGVNDYNQTQMAWMPIPTNYIAIVVNIGSAVADGKLVQMAYRFKPFGEVAKVKRTFDSVDQKQNEEITYVFDEKGILDIVCKAAVGGNTVSAYFDVIFIKKDTFVAKYGALGAYRTL